MPDEFDNSGGQGDSNPSEDKSLLGDAGKRMGDFFRRRRKDANILPVEPPKAEEQIKPPETEEQIKPLEPQTDSSGGSGGDADKGGVGEAKEAGDNNDTTGDADDAKDTDDAEDADANDKEEHTGLGEAGGDADGSGEAGKAEESATDAGAGAETGAGAGAEADADKRGYQYGYEEDSPELQKLRSALTQGDGAAVVDLGRNNPDLIESSIGQYEKKLEDFDTSSPEAFEESIADLPGDQKAAARIAYESMNALKEAKEQTFSPKEHVDYQTGNDLRRAQAMGAVLGKFAAQAVPNMVSSSLDHARTLLNAAMNPQNPLSAASRAVGASFAQVGMLGDEVEKLKTKYGIDPSNPSTYEGTLMGQFYGKEKQNMEAGQNAAIDNMNAMLERTGNVYDVTKLNDHQLQTYASDLTDRTRELTEKLNADAKGEPGVFRSFDERAQARHELQAYIEALKTVQTTARDRKEANQVLNSALTAWRSYESGKASEMRRAKQKHIRGERESKIEHYRNTMDSEGKPLAGPAYDLIVSNRSADSFTELNEDGVPYMNIPTSERILLKAKFELEERMDSLSEDDRLLLEDVDRMLNKMAEYKGQVMTWKKGEKERRDTLEYDQRNAVDQVKTDVGIFGSQKGRDTRGVYTGDYQSKTYLRALSERMASIREQMGEAEALNNPDYQRLWNEYAATFNGYMEKNFINWIHRLKADVGRMNAGNFTWSDLDEAVNSVRATRYGLLDQRPIDLDVADRYYEVNDWTKPSQTEAQPLLDLLDEYYEQFGASDEEREVMAQRMGGKNQESQDYARQRNRLTGDSGASLRRDIMMAGGELGQSLRVPSKEGLDRRTREPKEFVDNLLSIHSTSGGLASQADAFIDSLDKLQRNYESKGDESMVEAIDTFRTTFENLGRMESLSQRYEEMKKEGKTFNEMFPELNGNEIDMRQLQSTLGKDWKLEIGRDLTRLLHSNTPRGGLERFNDIIGKFAKPAFKDDTRKLEDHRKAYDTVRFLFRNAAVEEKNKGAFVTKVKKMLVGNGAPDDDETKEWARTIVRHMLTKGKDIDEYLTSSDNKEVSEMMDYLKSTILDKNPGMDAEAFKTLVMTYFTPRSRDGAGGNNKGKASA